MPAVLFLSMLNEAYRMNAAQKLELMNVASTPHMETNDRASLVEKYQHAASSPLDILDELKYENYDGIKELDDFFEGRA